MQKNNLTDSLIHLELYELLPSPFFVVSVAGSNNIYTDFLIDNDLRHLKFE